MQAGISCVLMGHFGPLVRAFSEDYCPRTHCIRAVLQEMP